MLREIEERVCLKSFLFNYVTVVHYSEY